MRSFARTLQMTLPGSGEVREVVVRVGLPGRDPAPGGDYQVLVEIDGLDPPYSRYFHGVEEIQALLEGCWIVPQILPALAPPGAKFTWLGEDDLGFGATTG